MSIAENQPNGRNWNNDGFTFTISVSDKTMEEFAVAFKEEHGDNIEVNKINTIKDMRKKYHIGLREAKEAVEWHIAHRPIDTSEWDSALAAVNKDLRFHQEASGRMQGIIHRLDLAKSDLKLGYTVSVNDRLLMQEWTL